MDVPQCVLSIRPLKDSWVGPSGRLLLSKAAVSICLPIFVVDLWIHFSRMQFLSPRKDVSLLAISKQFSARL